MAVAASCSCSSISPSPPRASVPLKTARHMHTGTLYLKLSLRAVVNMHAAPRHSGPALTCARPIDGQTGNFGIHHLSPLSRRYRLSASPDTHLIPSHFKPAGRLSPLESAWLPGYTELYRSTSPRHAPRASADYCLGPGSGAPGLVHKGSA